MSTLRILKWLALALALVAPAAASHSATLTVRPDGFGFFPTLQAAIDAAASGDTVLALPGTYTGPGNRNLDFAGENLCLVGRDGSAFTTIDCEHLGRALTLHSGESIAAVFKGFRILNGGDGLSNSGAIHCEDSGLALRDLWITGAVGSFVGGISYVHGRASIEGVIIEGCIADGAAGGIGLYWADSTQIRDCVIMANTASGLYGGGLEANNSFASLENVHFLQNHAGISGGGLSARSSTLTLADCLFNGNDSQDGAGIAIRGTQLQMRSSTFIGNYASRWGGALYYDDLGEPSGGLVENCDFRGNSSQWAGIITLMNQANPVLRNLTIVGNLYGDGINAGCCGVQAATIENCLIAFNQMGYGIRDNPTGGSWLSPSCSNVYGNEYGEYEGADQTGLNGNLSVDPLLCDPSFETLGLADNSPCLPENNTCGVLMGNHGAECTLTAVGAPAPHGVALEANYPNPFNPSTTIPFSLAAPAAVTLSIHDVSGRLVRVLADARSLPAGHHELRWDGLDAAGQPAPSGVYFYRLGTPVGATARPMLLVK